MATADRRPLLSWLPFALIAVVAAGALLAYVVAGRDESDGGTPGTGSEPAPVHVEATSIYQFATLPEMVAASDLVVRATAVSVERGRLVGDPDAGGIVSRTITLRVERVLAGDGEPATVIVEEEGWLADGTPVIVNGVAPTRVGDDGIWFLDSLDDPELPAYLIINSQGRYLVDGATLAGGDQRDALVRELQALTPGELEAQVLSPVRSTS